MIFRKIPVPPTTGTTQTCRPSTVVIIFCFNISSQSIIFVNILWIHYLCQYHFNLLSLYIIFEYFLCWFSTHLSIYIYFKDTGVDMVVNPYRFPPLPYYAMQYIHIDNINTDIDNINTDLSKNSWSKHQEIVCFK